MSEDLLAPVDFSRIPAEYEGLWVVLRVGRDQKVLGAGRTIDQAMDAIGVSSDDPTAVSTQVPESVAVTVMCSAPRT